MIPGFLLSFLFAVLPIAVIAGAIAAAVAARREAEREPEPPDPGIGTVRRLFVYVLALVALTLAATGVALLIRGALEIALEELIVAERSRSLSMALAFTLVGTPAWLVFAALAQRSLREHPVEARSQARRLYFGLARGIVLAIVAQNAITAGRALAGVADFSASAWGWLLAWGGVWLLHARLVGAEPPPTTVTRLLERVYRAFGAALGLFLLVAGIAQTTTAPLRSVYDRVAGPALLARPLDVGLREGLVVVAVGGAIWGWHWLRERARADRRSTLWHVQVFVFGMLPGVALTVVPLAVLLYTVLQWFLGEPRAATAATQFAQVPSLAGALLAGAATWGYHRALLAEAGTAREPQSEPERLYRYLATAAGLVTAAIGLATLLALAAEGLGGTVGSLVRSAGWWRNPLLRGLTLLVVGGPLWGTYWLRMQETVAHGGPADRASLSRRAFVFAATGVSLLALLISLTVLLFQVLQPLLDGALSRAVLRDARWSLAVALTTTGIAVYSLLVLREDQAALRAQVPAAPVRTREIVVIAAGAVDSILHELALIEGVRVRVWRRLDAAGAPALSAAQLAALSAQVRASEAARLALIVDGGGYALVPVAEAGT